jgi:hypothetical protein
MTSIYMAIYDTDISFQKNIVEMTVSLHHIDQVCPTMTQYVYVPVYLV